jgi:DNA-directed RNA polymerase subunit RPC12/RpoP
MNNAQQAPGFKCPVCGHTIHTSITELLTQRSLRCPHCFLQLDIDKNESKKAFEIMENVQAAQNKLDKAGKLK